MTVAFYNMRACLCATAELETFKQSISSGDVTDTANNDINNEATRESGTAIFNFFRLG